MVLKRRMMLFNQLALLTTNLATAIRYSGMEIYILLQQEYKNIKLPFISDVIDNLEKGLSLSESWNNSLDSLPVGYGLSSEDKSIIMQFGCKLGATDIEGQTEHCNYFKNIFQNKAELLKQDYTVKSKLYRTLGFFSGLAIVLVIV